MKCDLFYGFAGFGDDDHGAGDGHGGKPELKGWGATDRRRPPSRLFLIVTGSVSGAVLPLAQTQGMDEVLKLIFACACLVLLAGCDTDDGSDYGSSDDSGYSTDSVGSDYQPSYSQDDSSSSSSTSEYDRQAAQDQADQERADSQAEQDRQNEQTQSDLNAADQYHYNNDD